jgi:hypothetical protein
VPPTISLSDYVGAIRVATDLIGPPLVAPASVTKAAPHWTDVAQSVADQGLERWTWGLSAFGRPIVVRAARALLERILPVWQAGVTAGGADIKTYLDNIARGFDPSPRRLHDDIASWLRSPTQELADALAEATQGERLDLFDAIGNEEFQELWEQEPWMFVLTAAYAAAMTVYDDDAQLARAVGSVAISARRALAPSLGDEAVIETWRVIAAADYDQLIPVIQDGLRRIRADHGHEVMPAIHSPSSDTASGSVASVPSGGMPGREETSW